MATMKRVGPDAIEVFGVRFSGERVRQRFSRRRFGSEYKRLAEDLYQELLFDRSGVRQNGLIARAARVMTVRELAERYVREHLEFTRAKNNRSYIERACEKWGGCRISVLNKGAVRQWLVATLSAGANGYTVRKLAAYFTRVFRWGIEMQIIDQDPLAGLVDIGLKKMFRRAMSPRRTSVAPEQFDVLVSEFPGWLRNAVSAAWYTGMREGEVVAVKWSNIAGAQIRFDAGQTKEADDKLVVMEDPLVAIVDRIRADRLVSGVECEYVFTNESGGPLTTTSLSKSFRWHADRAGFTGVRFHDLRRSYRRRKWREGHDTLAISRQMGHHSAQVALGYDFASEAEVMGLRGPAASARKCDY